MDQETKEEFSNLEKENQQVRTSINAIMLQHKFNELEEDELWGLISNLIDNEIEQEDYCNE